MMQNRDRLLDFLTGVWGKEKANAFLSYKPNPQAFDVPPVQSWPEKSTNIAQWLIGKSGQGIDVYFGPALYKDGANAKTKENVIGSYVLWCDFDGNADEARAKLKAHPELPVPSYELQSGLPGHEHWYWRLDALTATQRFEDLNKRLAYYLDADMGCWSAEHVMRPPFTFNTLQAKKYDGKYTEGIPVDFIRVTGAIYTPEQFDVLPKVVDSIMETVEIKDVPTMSDVLGTYYWTNEMLELFNNPEKAAIEDKGGRSNVMIRVAYFCAETGMTDGAIYAVISDMDTRLKKFLYRNDRERQLARMIARVRSKHPYIPMPTKQTQEDVKLVYSIRELLAAEWEIEWLIDKFLPKRTINFISAESGIGKSRISLQLADAMARGIDFLKWPIVKPLKVVYLSLEMDGPMLKHFVRQLSDESDEITDEVDENFLLYPVGNPIDMESEAGLGVIESILEDYRPDVLFIDALGSLTLDELGEKNAKTINNHFKRLLGEYETTYYIIHHNRKDDVSGKKRPTLGSVYGNQYIVTDAAIVLTMFMPENQQHVELIPVKTRAGVSPDPVVMEGKDQFKFRIKREAVLKDDDGNNKFDDIN